MNEEDNEDSEEDNQYGQESIEEESDIESNKLLNLEYLH